MKPKRNFIALWLLCAVLIICAVIFVPYVVTGKAFILGWDMRTIYSSNFENLRTMVDAFRENHTLPYWSWANFLGNDFYSSKLFYFNDFFEYFFVFTKLPYSEAIIYMTFLRFLTAAFGFYAYCRYQKASDFTCVVAPLLYTFSAYLLQIMRDPFFASFITFLPLYFLAVDRYICEKSYYEALNYYQLGDFKAAKEACMLAISASERLDEGERLITPEDLDYLQQMITEKER